MEEGGGDWSCDQFTIVHSTGIFIHHLKWCRCSDSKLEDRHLQLLRSGILPSSIVKPKTAFTFDVLDNFLIDALECKTSARSFYQKLCRLSNNAFPDSLPVSNSNPRLLSLLHVFIQDRYRELMRVSRMWRDLSNRKRAGFGHDTEKHPRLGDLATFCPACPQPGINLLDNWRDVYNRLVLLYVHGEDLGD